MYKVEVALSRLCTFKTLQQTSIQREAVSSVKSFSDFPLFSESGLCVLNFLQLRAWKHEARQGDPIKASGDEQREEPVGSGAQLPELVERLKIVLYFFLFQSPFQGSVLMMHASTGSSRCSSPEASIGSPYGLQIFI